jgi:hypothetical protein
LWLMVSGATGLPIQFRASLRAVQSLRGRA